MLFRTVFSNFGQKKNLKTESLLQKWLEMLRLRQKFICGHLILEPSKMSVNFYSLYMKMLDIHT